MTILILANYANGLYLFRKELLESFKNAGHKVIVSVPFDMVFFEGVPPLECAQAYGYERGTCGHSS